jgi:Tol biopolymer transport system component
MDVDGANKRTVYDSGSNLWTPAFPPGSFDPAWSPDDQSLLTEQPVQCTRVDLTPPAWKCAENFGSGRWHVLRVPVAAGGGSVVDLSIAGGHADQAEYLPSFSPDGQRIIFGTIYEATPATNSYVGIVGTDAAGGNATRLVQSPYNNMYPQWLP